MKAITIGKKDQCANVVKDAARKATEEAITELEESGVLNGDNLQRILEKGDHVSAEVKKFVKGLLAQMAESIMGCLKLISGAETLTLDPTDGIMMISSRKDVFDGWIDPDFGNYGCDCTGQPTEAMNVQVHEMIKDGDFRKIYDAMGDDLDAMCLTQPQIVGFVQKYRNWLRTDGYGTFFLFKVGADFFVAYVSFDSGPAVRARLPLLVRRCLGRRRPSSFRDSATDPWELGFLDPLTLSPSDPSPKFGRSGGFFIY